MPLDKKSIACTLFHMLDSTSTNSSSAPASLGSLLRAARLQRGLSLRAVEAETGISNGYLSQLESDSVKAPSPRHLFELARVYGVSYAELMLAAEYPLPEATPMAPAPRQPASGLVFAADFLTPEDENKVRGYADALRAQYAAARQPKADPGEPSAK